MKPVIVGHSYLAEENRKKLVAISKKLESDITVISPGDVDDGLFQYGPSKRTIEGPGYEIRLVDTIPGNGTASSILRRVKRIVASVDPDIVALESGPYAVPTFQMAMNKILRRIRRPVVGFVRQPILTSTFPGKRVKKLLGRFTLQMLDGVQIASKKARIKVYEKLVHKDSVPSDVVYPIGVDPELFSHGDAADSPFFSDTDSFVVGYCGRIVERKGLSDLVRSIEDIQGEIERGVVLSLLGDGDNREMIERLGENLGVDIQMHSTVPHSEVADFMRTLDVFALPSRITENWVEHDAHSAVEAMACGIPVVGSTSGVIPEIIDNIGITFEAGNVQDLSNSLYEVLSSEIIRDEMGRTGVESVHANYNHDQIASETICLWRRVIDKYE